MVLIFTSSSTERVSTERVSELYAYDVTSILSDIDNMPSDDSAVSLLYSLVNENTIIADKQYYTQRRHEIIQHDPWDSFSANFPCFWGESFIDSELDKQQDGGKWGCGLPFIQKPCIVYSIGSERNFKFEYGVNEITKNKCDIYTFDPFNYPSDEFIKNLSHSNIHFYKWGITDIDNPKSNMYRLDTIMSLLNHTYIDILKIDVEGYEYPAFYSLHKNDKWPSIGQILIEIHANYKKKDLWNKLFGIGPDVDKNNKHLIATLIQLLETYQFRIFHREINMMHVNQRDCFEYSFIQKNWRPNIKHYNTAHRTYKYENDLQ